jgi:hypothetical protein
MSSFKLEQQVEGENTIVTLDGDLTGEYVKLVESYLQRLLSTETNLILKLRGIQTITFPAMELLQRLADKGVVLLGSGLYTEHIIERITARGMTH